MTVEVVLSVDMKPLNEFADLFLVESPTAAHTIGIVTTPDSATVSWAIEPIGEHSGGSSPTQGTSKTFMFEPTGAKRPKSGSKNANKPIEYRLRVTASLGDTAEPPQSFIIRQSARAILRQEYLDYGLRPPAFEDVVVLTDAETAPHFRAIEFIRNSNYSNDGLGVKGGMQEIAVATRIAYGRGIVINSGYRNPQRNKAVKGVLTSVHQTGGAVDMRPTDADSTTTNKVALYRAACTIVASDQLVLLERKSQALLPGRWNPPAATHIFQHQAVQITMQDDQGDGLPHTIAAIANAPPNGISNSTLFEYNGNGHLNPPFRFSNNMTPSKNIEVGDKLFLVATSVDPKLLMGKPCATLKEIFDAATHVHADARNVQKLLTDPLDHKKDDLDPFGTYGQTLNVPVEMFNKWGTVNNARRLLGFTAVSEVAQYEALETLVVPRTQAIDQLLATAKQKLGETRVRKREEWGVFDWPIIADVDFDWAHDTLVIHHSGNAILEEWTPLRLEERHRAKKQMVFGGEGWADVGYHFIVDQEGVLFEGRNLLFKGSHVEGGNTGKIGIVILGDFEPSFWESDNELMESQRKTAIELIKLLKTLFPTLTTLGGHKDFKKDEDGNPATECPGKTLYDQLDSIRAEVGLAKPSP